MSQLVASSKGSKKSVVPAAKQEPQTVMMMSSSSVLPIVDAKVSKGGSGSSNNMKSSGRVPAHRQVIQQAAQLGIERMSINDGSSNNNGTTTNFDSSSSDPSSNNGGGLGNGNGNAVDEYEAAKGKKQSRSDELAAERRAVADLDKFNY